jgi:hypothetical protein
VLLAMATIAVLAGRPRGVGRVLGVAWVVQAVVAAVLFAGYLVLLVRGHGVRDEIPQLGRLPTFESSFASPLLDAGTVYYAGWFVVMNVAAVLVLRSLGRVLRTLRTPAPGTAAPAR